MAGMPDTTAEVGGPVQPPPGFTVRDARCLSPEALDALRERAIAAILGGMSQTEVARVFNLNRVTVSGWWGAYRSGGAAALLSQARGRKPRQLLTPDQAERLRHAVVDHRPDELGLPFTLWTQRAVEMWAERELGI